VTNDFVQENIVRLTGFLIEADISGVIPAPRPASAPFRRILTSMFITGRRLGGQELVGD